MEDGIMKPFLTSSDPPGWYRCRVCGFTSPVHAVRWWDGVSLFEFDSLIAGYIYAMKQGDTALQVAITRKLGQALTTAYEEACSAFRRHDLTRTGRSRTLRPRTDYAPSVWGGGTEDYGMRGGG